MNAILKPSVSLEIASAKEVQQAMANFAEVSKAWHPVAYEQGLQLWQAKRAAKESARAAFPTPPLAIASPFARDSRDSPKWTAYSQARYP